jgi:hypothetical protein
MEVIAEQEKDAGLWRNWDNKDFKYLQNALRELHETVKGTIDVRKLKRTYSRLYGDPMIPLKIINCVYTLIPTNDLDPLASPGPEEFQENLYESIKKFGLKDPFTVHYVTNVPIKNRHGCLIKTGNNRHPVCVKLGIKEVPCIVINLSGECRRDDTFNEPYIKGEVLRTEEDVRKFFHTSKVSITWRDKQIVNAYTPYFLRIKDEYSMKREEAQNRR